MASFQSWFSANRTRLIRWTIYTAGLLPAIWTYQAAIHDRLGADPVRALEHVLGLWCLRFLIAGLAITPLRKIGGPNLIAYRRALGLLAFGYATLHLITYLYLDQALQPAAIFRDILKRPYITIGMASFVILASLAITSSNAMIRTLGGPAWNALHRWVYAAAVLAILHFIMVAKTWTAEPLIYAGILVALLLWRVWDRIVRSRRRTTRLRADG